VQYREARAQPDIDFVVSVIAKHTHRELQVDKINAQG
jgi:hypothetical protein